MVVTSIGLSPLKPVVVRVSEEQCQGDIDKYIYINNYIYIPLQAPNNVLLPTNIFQPQTGLSPCHPCHYCEERDEKTR